MVGRQYTKLIQITHNFKFPVKPWGMNAKTGNIYIGAFFNISSPKKRLEIRTRDELSLNIRKVEKISLITAIGENISY